jgi:phage gp46-like protein
MTAYQGDPKKIIYSDGSTLQFRDGDYLRDRGIENAVMYSLFVKRWFANVFANRPNQRLESNFEELHDKSITVDNILDIEDSAKKSLQWLIDSGVASAVEATTTVDANSVRHTNIVVYPPTGSAQTFLLSKYATNWEMQVQNPANEQVER